MSNVRVIVWCDVLVVCDDGRSVPADYDELFNIVVELTTAYPQGIGLLSIIPEDAVPPSDQVRAAMNHALERTRNLRGACWCIEGSGFQAAMVRAVLLGLRFLRSAPYPRHTASDLRGSLAWLLPLLGGGPARLRDLDEVVAYVTTQRERVGARVIKAASG